jgi:hypothetical protein
VISIVFFTYALPSAFADQLALQGIHCHEALAVSEVFHLCENTEVNLVVIDASVDEERAKAVQQRFPGLRLHEGATAEGTLWELANLLGRPQMVQ